MTSAVTSVASVHKPRFKTSLNTIVLLTFLCSCFTDLRGVSGSYGNLPLKAIRLSVDINDVLLPDPSLMPFLSGLCHQCKDELFLLHLCNLPAFSYCSQGQGFLPEEDIQRVLCFISRILVEPGFEDKEWSSSPVLLSSGAAHGKQQKEPLAGTAAAEDSGLLNPLAHPFLIPIIHTGFVHLFHGLGLQIHTLITP